MNKVMAVNITWNPYNWKTKFINPKATHSFARNNVGHESLNFDFYKENIDTDNNIYGYFERTNNPKNFDENGVIIFYTTNTDTEEGLIIGIYGNAKIIEKTEYNMEGFQNNKYIVNITGEKKYSMLFPKYLSADKYKKDGNRLVGQVGYTYYDLDFLENILIDEIKELSVNEELQNDYLHLKDIYKYYYSAKDLGEININQLQEGQNQGENGNSDIIIPGRQGVTVDRIIRNTEIIKKLKRLYNNRCQICDSTIELIGRNYSEGHHLKPLGRPHNGPDIEKNVIIVCPNCHVKLDYDSIKIGALINLRHEIDMEYILYHNNKIRV